jgi:hypothetical protein
VERNKELYIKPHLALKHIYRLTGFKESPTTEGGGGQKRTELPAPEPEYVTLSHHLFISYHHVCFISCLSRSSYFCFLLLVLQNEVGPSERLYWSFCQDLWHPDAASAAPWRCLVHLTESAQHQEEK